jgi:hypothetical protein
MDLPWRLVERPQIKLLKIERQGNSTMQGNTKIFS